MYNSLQTLNQENNPELTKKKSKKSLFIYINILLFVIVLLLGVYILKKENFFAEDQKGNTVETEDTEEPEEKVVEPTTSEFVGEYITATLPLGWSVKEEELDLQFNGFEITHGSTTIMEIEILDGVGSIGCPQIVLFSDSPENYEEDMREMNMEVGLEGEVLDYTNTKYSDISLFGLRMRRVGNRVFFDTDEKTETFEGQCEGSWIVIEDLSEIASTNYFNLTISNKATAEELNLLDIILESMRLR